MLNWILICVQACKVDFFLKIYFKDRIIILLIFCFACLTQAHHTELGLIFPLAHFHVTNSLPTFSGPDEGLITRWLLRLWVCFVEQTCCGWKILHQLISCTLSQHGPVRAGDEFIFPLLPCVSCAQLELCTNHIQPFRRVQVKREECSSPSLGSVKRRSSFYYKVAISFCQEWSHHYRIVPTLKALWYFASKWCLCSVSPILLVSCAYHFSLATCRDL